MKTTKKDFEAFKKEGAYWIDYYGLKNWRIEYAHKYEEARATVEMKFHDKVALVTLSNEWDDDLVNSYNVAESAFHEITEIKYATVRATLDMFVSPGMCDEIVHDLIRVDENTIFKKDYTSRRKAKK